jgi:IclR family acetate operon transcriptional repressor
VQNVLNALRVLEEVAARQPAGVADLARATDIPKSSVQRALRTLQEAGWIRPAGDGLTRWVITTKALDVGRHAVDLSLREAAMPVMEDLRRRTDETVHLAMFDGGKLMLVERLETSKPVRIVLPLGMSFSLHASAQGKAVLAFGPASAAGQALAGGLPRYTETTIIDPDELRAELQRTRDRGYAVNTGEWRPDVSAVAAAVTGGAGDPVATISVSVPTSRMTAESQSALGALVRAAAAAVSAALARERPAYSEVSGRR